MNATATHATGDKMTAKAMYEMARTRRNEYWGRVVAASDSVTDIELDHLIYMFERWNTIASRYVAGVRKTRKPLYPRANAY